MAVSYTHLDVYKRQVMNIVLTAIGVLLGLFVNIRYAKMVEQAEAEN